MSSSAASSHLPRILLGSLIGAVIGLILLALGVAVLGKAADPRRSMPESEAAALAAAPEAVIRSSDEATSPLPYPAVGPGSPPPQAQAETPARAATSIWRSIFDDADVPGEDVVEPAAAPSVAASPHPAPRPPPPRRPPEAQRQDDSLFF